jgi:hypothetical protein
LHLGRRFAHVAEAERPRPRHHLVHFAAISGIAFAVSCADDTQAGGHAHPSSAFRLAEGP